MGRGRSPIYERVTRAILNVDGYMVGPPAVGSVVYCGLGVRAIFHSGISFPSRVV